MRPKLLVLLAIAMFCGVVVAKCTAVILEVTPATVQADSESASMVTVLSVNDDVPAGKRIPIENIVVYRIPEENLPYDAVTSFFDVSNGVLKKKLTKGDVLFHHQFSQIADSQKEVFVPPGHRIVTVQVHGDSKKDFQEFQKIQSGDRVDIQLVKKESRHSKIKESVVTILENIAILDTETEFSLDIDQRRARNKVSLLLNEEQTALVHDSQEAGKLRLFVRPVRQTLQAEQNESPTAPVSHDFEQFEEGVSFVAIAEETREIGMAEPERKPITLVNMSFEPIREPLQVSQEVVAAPATDSYAEQYTPTITIESSTQTPAQSRPVPNRAKKYSSFYDSGQSGWSANPYY